MERSSRRLRGEGLAGMRGSREAGAFRGRGAWARPPRPVPHGGLGASLVLSHIRIQQSFADSKPPTRS